MNYQNKPPREVIDILKKNNIQYYDLSYYAWPEIFGSTAGPCGGIGGQAMSCFTIEAWVCDGDSPTVFTCCGMYYLDKDRFQPLKSVKHWSRIPKSIGE